MRSCLCIVKKYRGIERASRYAYAHPNVQIVNGAQRLVSSIADGHLVVVLNKITPGSGNTRHQQPGPRQWPRTVPGAVTDFESHTDVFNGPGRREAASVMRSRRVPNRDGWFSSSPPGASCEGPSKGREGSKFRVKRRSTRNGRRIRSCPREWSLRCERERQRNPTSLGPGTGAPHKGNSCVDRHSFEHRHDLELGARSDQWKNL
jgi:hypothetical protein